MNKQATIDSAVMLAQTAKSLKMEGDRGDFPARYTANCGDVEITFSREYSTEMKRSWDISVKLSSPRILLSEISVDEEEDGGDISAMISAFEEVERLYDASQGER